MFTSDTRRHKTSPFNSSRYAIERKAFKAKALLAIAGLRVKMGGVKPADFAPHSVSQSAAKDG